MPQSSAHQSLSWGGRALGDWSNENFNKEVATDEAKAQREWDAWSAKLDAGFADRKLDTPARHAAFDEFIKSNPAPTWVSVSHDPHVNRIGIRATRAAGALDPATDAYGTGLAETMGGIGLGLGGAMLATSANRLAQVGGGALLGAAAGMVIAGFTSLGSNGRARMVRSQTPSIPASGTPASDDGRPAMAMTPSPSRQP